MRVASAPIFPAQAYSKTELLPPPEWVTAVTALDVPVLNAVGSGLNLGSVRNDDFCRVAVRIDHAIDLNAAALREQTRLAYLAIFSAFAESPGFSPVRFWNVLPGIHDRLDRSQNRYMIFNSGRYLAFEKQYGSHDRFDQNVATASAVGHHGQYLWIHGLASRAAGIHLGNPRQVSPHRYSSRFGKRPPCFARATYLAEHGLLLIGGTASICGEDSLHDHLAAQTKETFENLGRLMESAAIRCGCPCPADPLGCMIDLRVYHPRKSDADWLDGALRDRVPNLQQLSIVRADLCRAELLVEIEGIARMTPACA